MPTSRTAKKRVRQNERRKLRHKARRSEIKSMAKKVSGALTEKDAKKTATELKALQQKLDKAAAAHSLHPNTVARQKSRLQRKLNKLAKGGTAPKA